MGSPKSAYRRINKDLTSHELQEIFTPVEEDCVFAKQCAKQPIPQMGCLIHLTIFRHLGYFVSLDNVPSQILEHIAAHSQLSITVSKRSLLTYDVSGSKKRHVKQIRQYLGVKAYTDKQDAWLIGVAEDAVETKNIIEDIINVLLEELVRQNFEIPSYSKLKKTAQKARIKINNAYYQNIVSQLTPNSKAKIDELLTVDNSESYSAWYALKREPKKPTTLEVRRYLQHVHWLQALRTSLPEVNIPPAKLNQYTIEARALDVAEMTALTPLKRYALAVILVRSQHSKSLDDVALLFSRLVGKMESNAQISLQQFILQHQKAINRLILKFRDVLAGLQDNDSQKSKLAAIEESLGTETDELKQKCDEFLAYSDNNYLPFLLKGYRTNRSLLLNCLTILELRSTSSDVLTEQLAEFLRAIQNKKSEHIEPEYFYQFTGGDIGTQWMPEKWRRMVLVKKTNENNTSSEVIFNRKYLELCILVRIKQELRSIDLYIPYSNEYADYREELVDDETFFPELPNYGEQVGLPVTDPGEFVKYLKQELVDVSKNVDDDFPENSDVSFNKDGRLSLGKPAKKKPTEYLKKVEKELLKRIPSASIVDILTDVSQWLDLHTFFSPLSGNQSRLDNPRLRFVITLFCYGCDIGASQIERSVKGLSRRQVSWLNKKHVTEERLINLDKKIINTYRKFNLPKYWGSGESAAADGTKWDLYEQNLMSEYHIRYGGYGGIGYYHVSDTYIALYSHFITCGAYEGTYILDGLIKNESEIQPNKLHGDTHAQNYTVFAMAYLLGIDLMPRIRKVSDLIFYRPDKRFHYKNIDSLFSKSIDWKLIETHLMDMLRIVISIKKGKITPSTILRRLSTYNRKNKLYFAFRELGAAVRTIFLLKYIDKVEIRQMITAATNKNEEFNNFVKWFYFGGDGTIAENLRPQQRIIVKYNQIVANMVTLYNVVKMEEVFEQLIDEGWAITPEILAGFSPYRMATVNRFGDYTVNLDRELAPIDFDKIIVDKIND